ncbi:MAG: arginine--tRNA ligase [bacterium]|nr:arginine--tRNA ligase [bacterium]
MSIKKQLQHIIKQNIDNSINKEDINIEIPKNKEFGDYSTNIALKLKIDPEELANKLKADIIDNVFVVKPGFINFIIKKELFFNNLLTILKEKENYGKSNIGNNKKINIEFVSVNPTGLLHIGHARGATYGDNLTRILNFIGYDATSEYYINDAGNQMNNLGISIKERYKEQCGLSYELNDDCYKGKEIIEIAKNIYNEYNNSKLNESIEYFKEEGLNILLKKIKEDLERYRVTFSIWTSEQNLYNQGLVDDIIKQLRNKNEIYIKDEALWLKTTKYQDDQDRVIIKSDGTYTYLLPDIAYHIHKIKRGYEELIDVLGADHHGYIKRLKAAIEILGYNPNILDIKILQMVRIIKDNKEIKLSKRTGKTITLNDLVDEVGVNATRYFFSSRSIDSMMDFDMDLALKQSNDNPIFYIEYANARITSILRKVNKNNIHITTFNTLNSPYIHSIIKKLYEFPNTVINAGTKKTPHLIATYVYELANLFHTYYHEELIITDNIEYTNERIVLLQAIKIVINNALDLIGIIPREEM